MRARYGITFTGLLAAGGAGVFLGMVPLGYLGLLYTAVTAPPQLMALPGALPFGALAGAVVAHATRARLRPAMTHRHRRFSLAGLATMPGAVFAGQLPGIADDSARAPASGTIMLILGCGVAGMVIYYRARKRRALQHQARSTAARHPDERPALR